ncbi:sigma-70 family RNA polymerase sigma factor [Kitasatospora sp. MBT63]|uniref:sigma-70 family RNA polymerase sigma factor n=1 Tax=Kitasatospora sp. MBT63 TaxID=1444768 RepID=UPI00068CFD73|nr:sigma-70 family RNA polymerase sigma factor [Kitasatospora sp. MBT63]
MATPSPTPIAPRPGDAELALAAGRNDPAALGLLLEGYRARLNRQALALLGDPHEAADAVQDTFLIALSRLSELRTPAAFGGWLARIQRNVCLMRLRAARERPADDITARLDRARPVPSAEECVERLALGDWVWQALGELPEPLRVTAMLRYFGQQHSYREIAAITGVPLGTVRSRLHQLRAVLAQRLLDEAGRTSSAARDAAGKWTLAFGEAFEAFNRYGEPGPLATLFAPDVTARVAGGPELRGRGEVRSRLLEGDLADGVRYRLVGVVASGGLAVVEARFVNPPGSPYHCPPAFTQVLHHRGFQAYRATTYYAARPDGDPYRENG